MNIQSIFVCLFLLIDTPVLVMTKNYESIIHYYQQRVTCVTEKESSECSLRLSLDIQRCMDDREWIHGQIEELQELADTWDHRLDTMERKLEKYKEVAKKQATYLKEEHRPSDQQLTEKIHTLQQSKKKAERILDRQNKWKERMIRQEMNIEQAIKQLQACQQTLHDRFQQAYPAMLEKGNPRADAIFQGDKDLPGYGSVTASLQMHHEACLADGVYDIDGYSTSWIPFVRNGVVSAGTWAYPGGGMHLGLDVAAPLFSPVTAGANGIVLYADNPVDSNCGYLGNYCGWPLGGGNTICMIMAVNGKLYGINLDHLSNQIFVRPGQQVRQGDVLALSGNSGNSTRPHTHIEVFELLVPMEQAVAYFAQGADFTFGNGFNAPATCSSIACRIRPETTFY